MPFGLPGDLITIADFDGDGSTDIAIYRDCNWHLLGSQTGYTAFQFGLAGDIPQPADYNGDCMTDTGVFRGGIWYQLQTPDNSFYAEQFGVTTDLPTPAAF